MLTRSATGTTEEKWLAQALAELSIIAEVAPVGLPPAGRPYPEFDTSARFAEIYTSLFGEPDGATLSFFRTTIVQE